MFMGIFCILPESTHSPRRIWRHLENSGGILKILEGSRGSGGFSGGFGGFWGDSEELEDLEDSEEVLGDLEDSGMIWQNPFMLLLSGLSLWAFPSSSSQAWTIASGLHSIIT